MELRQVEQSGGKLLEITKIKKALLSGAEIFCSCKPTFRLACVYGARAIKMV